jgi:diguanylate cyclase (GGDEF)-like protein
MDAGHMVVRRVASIAAALGALAVAVAAAAPARHVARLPGADAWMLAAAFAAAELLPVHFELRREAVSLSISTVPLVIGLYTVAPWALVAARVAGTVAALRVHRHQAPLKLAVNASGVALETAIAAAVFREFAPAGTGTQTWPAALGATVAGTVALAAALTVVISIYQGRWDRGLAWSMVRIPILAPVEASLGLVAVTILATEPSAMLPLGVVAVFVLASYRTHGVLRARHRDLEQLYAFAGAMSEALRTCDLVPALLAHTAELMHADRAWLVLADTCLEADGSSAPAGPEALAAHEAAHAAGTATLLQDVIAAPLRGTSGPLGTLVVAHRSGDVRRFGRGDLPRMVAVAEQASVALEHADLVHQLRVKAAEAEHHSLHDALTELPNRAMFTTAVDDLLETGTDIAVLLVDLDRFKEVNDALGHHIGDRLLEQVGRRLRAAGGEGDLVARLGGDEFAVMLAGVATEVEALRSAYAFTALLERPFTLGDMTLEVGASIGVAISGRHGADAGTLLQHADVAMYTAKADQSGVEVYSHDRDAYSAERLALVSELRAAINGGQLEVHYQPQVDLGTGEVFGVEALARWRHPTRGLLTPDEFISVAEHTGLISALTGVVLETAVTDAARWRDAGSPMRVSVNLSARTLLHRELVDTVRTLLRHHGLPRDSLCVEITEGSVMSDPRRSIAILEQLRAEGVTIALDDFGTGHSSLAYLKALPVGEIKVDKSFVQSMLDDPSDEAIVRSVVHLARNLGIPVIAEGVEHDQAVERLLDIGCRSAQGFLFSRPLPSEELAAWLLGRRVLAERPLVARR